MKVSRWKVASAIFAALMAFSLYGGYCFIQMPAKRSKNAVDLQYTQRAEYGYVALVKPSLLYDNRTEITAGEPLYLKLIEQLNITLQYELTQTPNTVQMTDIKLKYESSATLSGGDWTKTYNLKPKRAATPSFADTYSLVIEEIEEIVNTIGGDRNPSLHLHL